MPFPCFLVADIFHTDFPLVIGLLGKPDHGLRWKMLSSHSKSFSLQPNFVWSPVKKETGLVSLCRFGIRLLRHNESDIPLLVDWCRNPISASARWQNFECRKLPHSHPQLHWKETTTTKQRTGYEKHRHKNKSDGEPIVHSQQKWLVTKLLH